MSIAGRVLTSVRVPDAGEQVHRHALRGAPASEEVEPERDLVARLMVTRVVERGRVVCALLDDTGDTVENLPVGGGRVCGRDNKGREGYSSVEGLP